MNPENPFPMSISKIRAVLQNLGARHLIDRDPPRRGLPRGRISPTVTSPTILPPIIEVGTGTRDERDPQLSDFRNWRGHLAELENERGIDALAWYVSFHNTDDEWGIYIPISSLHHIAGKWLKGLRRPFASKLRLAFEALIHHESMHYAIDRNVAGWEMILGVPLHGQVPDRLKYAGYIRVEEAVANAHMMRELAKRHSGVCQAAIDKWVSASPPGYCEASNYFGDSDFAAGLEECVKIYAGLEWLNRTTSPDGLPGIFWASQYLIDGEIDLAECPLHIIDDQQWLDVRPTTFKYLTNISIIKETKKFRKMLAKLPAHIQKAWDRKRDAMKTAIPRHPEFEKLKGKMAGMYSIRIGDNVRAHLQPRETMETWDAVEIGGHTAMHHG